MTLWMGLLGFIAIAAAVIFVLVLLSRTHDSIRKELTEITQRVGIHLEQTARLSQQAGEGAVRAMSDVYKRLGSLEETSNRIYEIGREIGKLQDVLRAPKARGNFGEFILQDVLGQIIPRDHFQMQYGLRNGARVDAVIFVGTNLVPIDAKFPLDNFQKMVTIEHPEEKKKSRKEFIRDVKRHIDTIAERYICPEEGTFDFALMYVPAENVYYELIAGPEDSDSSLVSYALERHVVPVSPNSFYAYLQVILLGLRGLKMDQAAREIAESLTKMLGDFRKLVEDFGVLGTHLNHAKGSYEKVQRGMDQFQGKLGVVDQVKLTKVEHEGLEPTEIGKE